MFDIKFWEEIKEKYPKVLELFINFYNGKHVQGNISDVKYYYSEINTEIKIEIGETLFNLTFEMIYELIEKFFDEQNIFIHIKSNVNYFLFEIKRPKLNEFRYQYNWQYKVIFKSGKYKTRNEAKLEAVFKSFSILEQILNKD